MQSLSIFRFSLIGYLMGFASLIAYSSLVAIVALITYYWGGRTGLPKAVFDEDEDEEETAKTAYIA
jgi:hypothetical protein